jgi:hypothetical protein
MCTLPTRIVLVLVAGGLLGVLAAPPARVDAKQPGATLFRNVKVFDGKSDTLTASTSVLVVDNKIAKIDGNIAAPEQVTVIDGGGRTLMPGLIDAYWQPPANRGHERGRIGCSSQDDGWGTGRI